MRLLVLVVAVALAAPAGRAAVPARASQAFDRYATLAEKQLRDGPFLYSDAHPEVRPSARKGQTIVVEQKAADVPVTGGLIHDWLGVSFIPGASIASLRALMQDYDNYKRIYSPDIIDSRLISRDGGHFRAFLQLENTQFLKLIYDSDYDIQYSAPAADRMEIVSRSTRIQQSGSDQGFLWRLNSYWRFEQVEGGVYVQCRAISLSRDLPLGFGWLRGFLERFSRESMVNTMDATRRAAKSSPMHP
jgi:hypothetical protein